MSTCFPAIWVGVLLISGVVSITGCMHHSSAKQANTSTSSGHFTKEKLPISYEPIIPLDSVRDSVTLYFNLRSIGGASLHHEVSKAKKLLTQTRFLLEKERDLKKKIKLFIYPTVEAKGLLTHNTSVAHVDLGTNTIHRVGHKAFATHEDEAVAQLLLHNKMEKAKLPLMLRTGLAVSLTEHWREKGYQYWAAQLFRSGNGVPLSELLDDDLFKKESDLVMSCMAAVFVDFVLEKKGKDWLFQDKNTQSILSLETEWQQWMEQKLPPLTRHAKPSIPQGLRGFNFTHEGYNINDGYSGNRAVCALDTLCSIGANAAAIVPYSYMPNPNQPSFIPFVKKHPGAEHDEGVIFCLHEARRNRMFTMLKPQVWLGRGHWPGDVEMQSEADWDAFFDYYYRWMRHYTLLAAMYDADALCVGVEFAKATTQRPKDWRKLVEQFRKLYPGVITYAANWGDEFQNMAFADALDVVGLNCYYPLGNADDMTKEQLKGRFLDRLKKIDKRAVAWKRDIWFTEIGYPSLATPWKQPHAEPRGLPSNPEHQARCYAATLEAIAEFPKPMSQFWWKWATNPAAANLHDKEFMPTAKPAQEVIRKMWGTNE